jgi:uncharacterized protein YjbI with pentapeptide repeats
MVALVALASISLAAGQSVTAPVVFAPSPNSCQVRAGDLSGKGSSLPPPIDGTKLKRPSDIEALKNKAKGGPIVIEGGDFSDAKFGGGDFSNVCFRGTKLTGTRWTKTRGAGIGFINADLTGAVFDRVTFDFILFRNTTLARVDATGARLNYGRFDGGWDPTIAGLRLDNAQMQGFRFVCGTSASDGCAFDRKQLSLRGANLAGASIATFSLWDAVLDGVRLDQTEISVDQITQFSAANVSGPVLVRVDNKRITLAPDALAAAARAIGGTTKSEDTRCASPETPLDQLLCQPSQAGLRAQREDIDRLYQGTQEPLRPADGTAIVVRAANSVQLKYLKSLKNCARRDGDSATECLGKALSKRRLALVGELLAQRPLESDARAVFVSPATPLVQAISQEPKLAGLISLVIDASPSLLLAYRDDDDQVIAHGTSRVAGGKRCSAAFGPPPAKPSKSKVIFPTFAAWSTGAEFTIADAAPPKKKKKPKKNQPEVPVVGPIAAPVAGCGQIIQSGALVRIPVSEDDFDRLWKARKSRL